MVRLPDSSSGARPLRRIGRPASRRTVRNPANLEAVGYSWRLDPAPIQEPATKLASVAKKSARASAIRARSRPLEMIMSTAPIVVWVWPRHS